MISGVLHYIILFIIALSIGTEFKMLLIDFEIFLHLNNKMKCFVSHLIFATEKDEVHYRMLTATISPRQSKTGKKSVPFLDFLWFT